MKRTIFLAVIIMIIGGALACGRKVMVPPRIDLTQHEIVGIIQFECESKGNLAPYTTKKFTEAVRRDQPLIRIIDLGDEATVLADIGHERLSKDAYQALLAYLKVRPFSRAKRLFLVNKGRFRGQPLNARGIQHRMKYYSKKAGFKVSCHQLRHTMATQMLNADADLVTIQDLLGHAYIRTTERYCRVSNQKVRRDYYRAMDKVIERHSPVGNKRLDKEEILIN